MDSTIIASLVSSVITLLVGSVAIYLYEKAKHDKKRDAANIIYLEICSAERKIKNIKNETNENEDFGPVLKHGSWPKWKYLFLKDFDRDEWDAVNDFFERCALYDEAILSNSATFSKNEEQIRINVHRMLADYIKEVVDTTAKLYSKSTKADIKKKVDLIKERAETFEKQYIGQVQAIIPKPDYRPQKYADDRDRFLKLIDSDISTKPVGQKLKNIAKIKP